MALFYHNKIGNKDMPEHTYKALKGSDSHYIHIKYINLFSLQKNLRLIKT